MKESPYNYIADPIKAWCEENYYTDFLVTIWVGDHETTQFLALDDNLCSFTWEIDWWEGEKDVRLLGFAPLTDIHIHNYPKPTNYSRIVSKSPYELADWIAKILDHCENKLPDELCLQTCPLYKCCNNQPSDNIEDWLNATAEVDNGN